jgi:hypothetical protein
MEHFEIPRLASMNLVNSMFKDDLVRITLMMTQRMTFKMAQDGKMVLHCRR